jgi:carbamoyltransferase
MIILGLNYYFHDSTACLEKDGVLIAVLRKRA